MWYAQAHDPAERAVGFISNNHGEEGGVKGDNVRSGSEAYEASSPIKRACPRRLVYGADRVCLGNTKAHTPSVQLTLVSTRTGPGPGSWGYGEARGNTEATTSRQRSKLAEGSQEGENGREKWKVGDKTQGGGSKK